MKQASFSDTLIRHYNRQPFASYQGKVLSLDSMLEAGQIIDVFLPEEKNSIPPQEGPLSIVYEDAYLLILNKPSGLATLGTGSHFANNLAGHISAYYQHKQIPSRIHFVNRLDKETAGLILLAKHQYVHALLAKQTIIKKYYALVEGRVFPSASLIDRPIARLAPPSTKRIIAEYGQVAQTQYQVVDFRTDSSVLDITLLTGRTHQIRVHLAGIGHPLIGDTLYGSTIDSPLCLQSYFLSFDHPITKQKMTFTLPLTF
jgi:23S rRNA pseudouridine1911/1915/1917 synthase